MDSDSDTSPSPSRAGTRTHKRTRRSTGGHDSRSGRSSAELLKMLVSGQREVQELRSMLQHTTARLEDETRRADNAEKTARETVLRFKEANDMRLAAQLEATRAQEQLRLYKVQLETARQEIRKGQELLDVLESQRHEAEESAARARSTARKLKEEKVVLIAREEGREEGILEGMERGRTLGYEDGRAAGYESGWSAAKRQLEKRVVDVSVNAKTPSVLSAKRFSLPPEPEENIRIYPPVEDPGSPEPEPILEEPVELRAQGHQSPSILSINPAASVYHVPVDYPPDGWIPSVDEDQRIHLPPPHELAPAPPTPEATPPHVLRRTPVESPPLMIPPPLERPSSEASSDSDSVSVRGTARRPRTRRRKSDDSQSTTFSQFDLIGPPVASSARANTGARPNILSAIVEEKERSPSIASTMRRPMMSPSLHMPSPQAARGGFNQQVDPQRYLSPHGTSRRSPSLSPGSQGLSPKGSIASSIGYTIVVEPPSRPESWRSGEVPQTGGLLSPRDADRPLPAVPVEQPQVVSALPAGFIPSRPAPSAGSYTGATAAGVPLPPSTAPSSSHLHGAGPSTDRIPVIPLPTSGITSGRYSRAAVRKEDSASDESSTSNSSSSMDTLTTPPYPRKKPLPATTYASAPTPPNVTYPLAPGTSATYAAKVPLPPSTVTSSGTSGAARVPLPPSTAGSPRSVYTYGSRPGGGGNVSRGVIP